MPKLEKCLREKCSAPLKLAHENKIKHRSQRTGALGTFINRIYWCDACKLWIQIESDLGD